MEKAPAGAVEARLVFYFFQHGNQSGAVYVDRSLIEVLPDFLLGDFNADGAVDMADYIAWRKNGGTPQEYDVWRENFGQILGGGNISTREAQATVPEPANAMSLCFAAALLSCCARRLLQPLSKRKFFTCVTTTPYLSRKISADACFVEPIPSFERS